MTNQINDNTFAAACYDMNSILELKDMLSTGPDATDMKTWNLTASEWKLSIELAIRTKREDAA